MKKKKSMLNRENKLQVITTGETGEPPSQKKGWPESRLIAIIYVRGHDIQERNKAFGCLGVDKVPTRKKLLPSYRPCDASYFDNPIKRMLQTDVNECKL